MATKCFPKSSDTEMVTCESMTIYTAEEGAFVGQCLDHSYSTTLNLITCL
jgi:hypothetical protein